MRHIKSIFLGISITFSSALNAPISIAQDLLDDHGPHAGFIATAGSLVTEVLPTDSNTFQVYLLNERWDDIHDKGYSLMGFISSKTSKKSDIVCSDSKEGFSCTYPPSTDLSGSKGTELVIKVKKDKKQAVGQATYKLPLKNPAKHTVQR